MKCVALIATLIALVTSYARASEPTTRPTTLPGPRVEFPDDIRKALVRNAEQIGPITLAFTMQSSSAYSKEQAMEKLKLDEYLASFNASARQEIRMEWQDGKYRSWFHSGPWKGMPEDNRPEQTLEAAFDGETIYMADVRPKPDDPNVTPQGPVLQRFPLAVTPTKRIPLSSPSDWGHGGKYFDLAGIRLPSTIGELKASSSPRSKILWMLDCGATLAAIDTVDLAGHQCTRLRLITDNPERKAAEQIDDDAWLAKMRRISAETEESLQQMLDVRRQQRKLSEHRMFIFYLDPKLGYALRRSEERNDDGKDGSLLVSIDCEQFQPLNGRDLILPRKCILREYEVWNLPGTHFPDPTVSRTYEITDLKFDPIAQERFSLSYTAPGSEIHETLDADDTQSWGVIQEDGTLRDPRR